MYRNQSILAIIPARGGSKCIPGKNIKLLNGKPLIEWTLAAARESKLLDRVIISTDDPKIAETARELGGECPFMRPQDLSSDEADSASVVIHALQEMPPFDYFMLLQPTSPLRNTDDIDGAIVKCLDAQCSSLVSVTPTQANPFSIYRMDSNSKLFPLFTDRPQTHRRQDLPPLFNVNGAIYIANCQWFLENKNFISGETIGLAMPAERSIDIDEPRDWAAAENLITADLALKK